MAENAKHHYDKIKTLSLFVALAMCLAFRVSATAEVNTNRDISHIDIYVTPFYNSEGPTITAGPFSAGLSTTNEASFVATIREMKRGWQQLSFVEMYVAAIRLYDLGYRKESIYWFYSAQYRGRLFASLLDRKTIGSIGDPGFELLHVHESFYELVGPYINSYAFGDLDFLGQVIQRVKKEGEKLPDIKDVYPDGIFKKESEWPRLNREMAKGMGELLTMIKEQKEEIKKKRIESGVQAQFAGLSDKAFPEYSTGDTAAIDRHLKQLSKQEREGSTFEDGEKERQALIKLGYFERRTFQLKHRPVTTNTSSELAQVLTNFTFINNHFTLLITVTNQSINVTAHSADIPTWEKVISQFESGKEK